MRVFYDHQLFSMQDAGGAARYYYELIRHMQAYEDIDIDARLGFNRTVYPFRNLSTPKSHISGAHSPFRPGVLRYAVNETLATFSYIGRRAFDVYHPTLYRALRFVRHRRLVATHHDCAHERYPGMFRNSSVVIRNKRKLYDCADAIICVSESSRRDLLDYYQVDPARTLVIHHGFTPFVFTGNDHDLSDSIQRPYLLFVGFRGSYKNFDSLLRAFVESGIARDYDLLTVGGGRLSEAETCAAQKLGVASRVTNIQNIPDRVLAKLYKSASLFVYPSLHEGFGFPPLEAMSMGCPVLVKAASAMPEICGDAAYYFQGENLAPALAHALNDQRSRCMMKQRGLERVSCFSWPRAAAATRDVYLRVLNN